MQNGQTPLRIGIDVGGTKIALVILNDANDVLHKDRTETPTDYDQLLRSIQGIIQKARTALPQAQTATIGIGIPGELSRKDGTVKNSNAQVILGRPLQKDLEALLKEPVKIANDATCFALSEAIDGAASGGEVVFGVILGTGVGGGVVFNGKVWTGQNRIAGEWGHNAFPYREEILRKNPCYCGKVNCIETFLSGPSIGRYYESLSGKPLKSHEIYEASLSGHDQTAVTVMDEYYHNLAKCLAQIIGAIDPDVIVLGGGVSNIEALYEKVPAIWEQYIFNASPNPEPNFTRLVKNKWGDDSGVRGAAWLWR